MVYLYSGSSEIIAEVSKTTINSEMQQLIDLIKKYNLNYYRELGIPGRYAPQSAGEIIGKTIIDYVLTKEEWH